MNRQSARPVVLIVEDQADMAMVLAELLDYAGYDTTTALNGDAALTLAAANGPDLALVDLVLPGLDGIGVMQHLLVLDPQLPVIIVTGNGSPDRVKAAMCNGARDFFTKPFNSRELLASVAEALTHRPVSRDYVEVSGV